MSKRISIGSGIGKDKQHVLRIRVTDLQSESSEEGLQILQSCLGINGEPSLDAREIHESADPAIPGPLIAFDR